MYFNFYNEEYEREHSFGEESDTPRPSDTPLFRGESLEIPLSKGGIKGGCNLVCILISKTRIMKEIIPSVKRVTHPVFRTPLFRGEYL